MSTIALFFFFIHCGYVCTPRPPSPAHLGSMRLYRRNAAVKAKHIFNWAEHPRTTPNNKMASQVAQNRPHKAAALCASNSGLKYKLFSFSHFFFKILIHSNRNECLNQAVAIKKNEKKNVKYANSWNMQIPIPSRMTRIFTWYQTWHTMLYSPPPTTMINFFWHMCVYEQVRWRGRTCDPPFYFCPPLAALNLSFTCPWCKLAQICRRKNKSTRVDVCVRAKYCGRAILMTVYSGPANFGPFSPFL